MKKVLGLLGIVAACGACCAVPLALPMLGGLTASGLGLMIGWEAAVAGGLVATMALVMWVRSRGAPLAAAQEQPPSADCGCSDGCAAGTGANAGSERGPVTPLVP